MEWWQGNFDSSMDEIFTRVDGPRKRRSGQCSCTMPRVSARPNGKIRHYNCCSCNSSFSARLQEFENNGVIIYGFKGKNRGKRLWQPFIIGPWVSVNGYTINELRKQDGTSP